MQNGFQRLGLLPDADARAIRRAYAHALKKIDQAQDAAGFQELRGAYEEALQFAQWQAEQRAQEAAGTPAAATTGHGVPAVAPALPLPVEALPSADQLADAVAAEFCAALARLGVSNGGTSDAPYRLALRLALEDGRLFGIEARHGFELHVAMILAQGWRTGHEALLAVAVDMFGWSQGLKLASLGRAGAIIDRALEERTMFNSQTLSSRNAQRRVLQVLRQAEVPTDAQMRQLAPSFRRMLARFPHWLSIMAPHARIGHWQERVALPAPDANPAVQMAPLPASREKKRWPVDLLVWGGGMAVIAICTNLFKPDRTPPPRWPAPVATQYAPPVIRNPVAPLDWPKPAPVPEVPVTQARIQEIFSRIDYKPEKGEARIARKLAFDVFIDFEGKPFGVNLISGSGSAALDAAVKAAILGSKPFPPNTRKVFRFGVTYQPGTKTKRKPRPPE